METIIALLFVLLPIIFKLIGKKFEQAGQSERAERMREFAELFDSDDEDVEVRHDDDGQVTEVVPVNPVQVVQNTVLQKPTVQKPTVQRPTVQRQTKKKIMPVEEEKNKGEKIDPKKLVIYSEIMKPKFTE